MFVIIIICVIRAKENNKKDNSHSLAGLANPDSSSGADGGRGGTLLKMVCKINEKMQ